MNKTILVIDDDDILRNTLSKGLRQDGFNVITAPSAETADEILSRIRVDSIILDRMMTGMDGLSYLKKLRNQGNTTPVIMLTAMTGADNTIDGLTYGANDYLAKPFQIRELILRLNNIMSQTTPNLQKMPKGLNFTDNEFFITNATTDKAHILALSGEEKRLLLNLISPVGNIVPAPAMVAKRLRSKLNLVLSHLDIITVRSRGYKLLDTTANTTHKDL